MQLLEVASYLFFLFAPPWAVALPLLLFIALVASLLQRAKANARETQNTPKS